MIVYENSYHYNRNYGCRFKQIIYKGFRILSLENEKIKLSILLDKGADIIEFLFKPYDMDFMWKSPIELDKNTLDVSRCDESGSFLDYYEGGWQELLPSINLPHNYKNSCIGLHGELFITKWDMEVLKDDIHEIIIKLKTRMLRTPFYVEKLVTLKSNCTYVSFAETIKNEAGENFDFMWGHHPVLGKPFLNEYCYIDVPVHEECKTYMKSYSKTDILPLDKSFDWPHIIGKNGDLLDVSHVFPYDRSTDFRVFLRLKDEGWIGMTNLQKGIGFGIKWDPDIFKYILIWCNYRGYLGFPFYGRCFCVGLEPLSTINDNYADAIKKGQTFCLKPQESMKTTYYAIVYETNSRIKGFKDDLNIISKE